MKIPLPPIITVSSIIIAYLFALYIPVASIIPAPYNRLGLILVAAGIIFAGWSIGALQKRSTTVDPRGTPSALVTSGPFRFTRNPIYLGNVLVALGVSLYLGSLSAFIAPILTFSLINALVIPFEEQKLAELFAAEYEAYKAKVRRWV
jgi:protein-S-isoprenylcysteine O-methyltransferase Ste14